MKKAKILLAMLLAVSVFTFAGCGGNNNADDNAGSDNATVEETTDNVGQDLKDDAEDIGNDIKDGAEDMLDGTDKTDNNAADKNKDKETTK